MCPKEEVEQAYANIKIQDHSKKPTHPRFGLSVEHGKKEPHPKQLKKQNILLNLQPGIHPARFINLSSINEKLPRWLPGNTQVLSGPGMQPEVNLIVNVPTAAGDFSFELTAEGLVKLRRMPGTLDLDFEALTGGVKTTENVSSLGFSLKAREFRNAYRMSLAQIFSVVVENEILNLKSGFISGNTVNLVTKDALAGIIKNEALAEINGIYSMLLKAKRIENEGNLLTQAGTLQAQAEQIVNNGKAISHQNLHFAAKTYLENGQEIYADGMLNLISGIVLSNHGNIYAAEVFATAKKIDNLKGAWIRGNNCITLRGLSISNAGTISGGTKLKAIIETSELLENSGAINLGVYQLSGVRGAQNSFINRARIKAHLQILVNHTYLIENQGLIKSKGPIECLEGISKIIQTSGGRFISLEKLGLTAKELIQNRGQFLGKEVELITLDEESRLQNLKNALIKSLQTMNWTAPEIQNAGDVVVELGRFSSKSVRSFDNAQTGRVLVNGQLDIESPILVNKGLFSSDTHINLQADILTNEGLIKPKSEDAKLELNLNAKETIQNKGLLSGERVTLVATGKEGRIQNLSNAVVFSQYNMRWMAPVISNEGEVTVRTGQFTSQGSLFENSDTGRIAVRRRVDIEAVKVNNQGAICSAELIRLSGKQLSNQGLITAEKDTTLLCRGREGGGPLDSQQVKLLEERLAGQASIGLPVTLQAEDSIQNGGIISGSRVTLTSRDNHPLDTIHNQIGAQILSGEALILAAINVHNTGEIIGKGISSVFAEKVLGNSGSLSGESMKFAAETIENARTGILKGQDLSFNARALENNGQCHSLIRTDILVEETLQNLKTGNLSSSRLECKAKQIENAGQMQSSGLLHLEANKINNAAEARLKGQAVHIKSNEMRNEGQCSGETLIFTQSEQFVNAPGAKISCKSSNINAKSMIQEGELQAEQRLEIQTQSFSQTQGSIKAGNVCITAKDIKITTPIEATGDIEIFHEGGEWDVSPDMLRTKGKVTIHFKDGRVVEPLKVDGSLKYVIDNNAKEPLRFHANQPVFGTFEVEAPSIPVIIGNDKESVSLEGTPERPCQGIHIQAKSLNLNNGRLVGLKGIFIKCQELLYLGIPVHCTVENSEGFANRRGTNLHTCLGKKGYVSTWVPNGLYRNPEMNWSQPLHHKVGLMSAGDIVLEGGNVLWNHLELLSLSNLFVRAKELADIASSLSVQGNATFEVPRVCLQALTEVKNITGQQVPIGWDGADVAQRRFYEQRTIITPPARWSVGQQLKMDGQTVLMGSEISCNRFEGTAPQLQTLDSYQTYADYCLFSAHRNPWWCVYQRVAMGTPCVAKLSTGIIQTQSPILNISGILSSAVMELQGIQQGQIGWDIDLQLPAPKPFRSYIPLTEYAEDTSLFEVTEPGLYPTVYRPLLPFRFSGPLGPILVAGPQGLRPNIYNRRCLYTEVQEKNHFIKALMGELSRSFLHPDISDPYQSLKYLRDNAEQLTRTRTALVPKNANLTEPMVVYEEVEFVHASSKVEIVLVPVLCLPKSFDNPRLRDWAGGLFSLGGILVKGESQAYSSLRIIGHVDAGGKATFSYFDSMIQQRRMVREIHRVEDIRTESQYFGFNEKTRSTAHEIEVYTSEPGNTMRASEIEVSNVTHLHQSGLVCSVGAGGYQVHVNNYVQTPSIETRVESHYLKLGSTETVSQEPKLIPKPNILESQGPVLIDAERAHVYLNVNGTRVRDGNGPVKARHLTIEYIEEQIAAAEMFRAKMERDAQRTAKRKQTQGMIKAGVVTALTFYMGPQIGAALSTASTTLAASPLALAAAKGAVMGFMKSLVMQENPLKGALQGALFDVVSAGVSDYLGGIKSLENMEFLREQIATVATTAITTAVEGGDIFKNIAIASVSHAVARQLTPELDKTAVKPNPGIQSPIETTRTLIQNTTAGILRGGSSEQLLSVMIQSSVQSIAGPAGNRAAEHIHQVHKERKASAESRYQSSSPISTRTEADHPKASNTVKPAGSKTNSTPASKGGSSSSSSSTNEPSRSNDSRLIESVTEQVALVFARENTLISRDKVRQAVASHPAFQGSDSQVKQKLFKLGRPSSIQDTRSDERVMKDGFKMVLQEVISSLEHLRPAASVGKLGADRFNTQIGNPIGPSMFKAAHTQPQKKSDSSPILDFFIKPVYANEPNYTEKMEARKHKESSFSLTVQERNNWGKGLTFDIGSQSRKADKPDYKIASQRERLERVSQFFNDRNQTITFPSSQDSARPETSFSSFEAVRPKMNSAGVVSPVDLNSKRGINPFGLAEGMDFCNRETTTRTFHTEDSPVPLYEVGSSDGRRSTGYPTFSRLEYIEVANRRTLRSTTSSNNSQPTNGRRVIREHSTSSEQFQDLMMATEALEDAFVNQTSPAAGYTGGYTLGFAYNGGKVLLWDLPKFVVWDIPKVGYKACADIERMIEDRQHFARRTGQIRNLTDRIVNDFSGFSSRVGHGIVNHFATRWDEMENEYDGGNSFTAGFKGSELTVDFAVSLCSAKQIISMGARGLAWSTAWGSQEMARLGAGLEHFASTHSLISPITFQYSNRLNCGFPVDLIKFQKPYKPNPTKNHIKFLEREVGASIHQEHIDLRSGVGGIHARENFASAREAAKIRANLGDDAVPFLQELGPDHLKGSVYTGMQSPDGTRGWRLDRDIRTAEGAVIVNRTHINWWFQPDPSKPKLRFKGMIPIAEATPEIYWDILSHFPRKKR